MARDEHTASTASAPEDDMVDDEPMASLYRGDRAADTRSNVVKL